jgi:hypothetical protein
MSGSTPSGGARAMTLGDVFPWAVLLTPLSLLVAEAVTDTGVPVWGMVLMWLALQFVALWSFAQEREANRILRTSKGKA